MDLRSIINTTDSNSNALPPRSASKPQSPISQVYMSHVTPHQATQSPYGPPPLSAYERPRVDIRPVQLHPFQQAGQHDNQSPIAPNTYQHAQSPYTNTPTSALPSGQYPFPHHPTQNSSQGVRMLSYQPQDRATIVNASVRQTYGQPSPQTIAPIVTTPGSSYAYAQFHRPQSSHSSATPTSAQSHIQNFPRDSPRTAYARTSTTPQSQQAQQFQSQPGTPLGQPSYAGRPSPTQHRESLGSHSNDTYRASFGGYHTQVSLQSPIAEKSPSISERPPPISERPPPPAPSATYKQPEPSISSQGYMVIESRERSVSVSPKTRLPSQVMVERSESAPEQAGNFGGRMPSAQRQGREASFERRPSFLTSDHPNAYSHQEMYSNGNTLIGNPGLVQYKEPEILPSKLSSVDESLPQTQTTPTVKKFTQSYSQKGSDRPIFLGNSISGPSPISMLLQQPQPPQHQPRPDTPLKHPSLPSTSSGLPAGSATNIAEFEIPPSTISHSAWSTVLPTSSAGSSSNIAEPKMPSSAKLQSAESTASPGTMNSTRESSRKRHRPQEEPVFARKASRATGAKPHIRNRTPGLPRAKVSVKPEANHENSTRQMSPTSIQQENNGNGGSELRLSPIAPGPLGPWEPTISNVIPVEELTKVISDFVFEEVMGRNDVGMGSAGGGVGSEAMLEIEAKIGQLIDKDTDDRLRLPVVSECILNKGDPKLRTIFKSSMTEAQHSTFNQFLNGSLMASLPPKKPSSDNTHLKPRIPMTYIHTKQVDSFYELSQAAEASLPPSIRAQAHRQNKAKVRITRDQKTGKELAKIIKVRVADLDVYSPKTPFDWRVSINLEMRFDGDMRDLIEVSEGGKRVPERNKDRLTYKHLAYQFDLTQVTMAEANSLKGKEHELEIELDTAEVRKHGNLLMSGQRSGYEELLRGFVDNVRILARHCIKLR